MLGATCLIFGLATMIKSATCVRIIIRNGVLQEAAWNEGYLVQGRHNTLNLNEKGIRAIQPGLLLNVDTQRTEISKNSFLTTSFFLSLPLSSKDIVAQLNGIQNISPVDLGNFYCLGKIDLNQNKIKILRAGTIYNAPFLRSLSLAENKIENIEPGFFEHLGELTHLYLRNNNLHRLKSNVFSYLKNIQMISLPQNKLKFINTNIFAQLPGFLQIFDVRANRLLRDDGTYVILGETMPSHRVGNGPRRIAITISEKTRMIGIDW